METQRARLGWGSLNALLGCLLILSLGCSRTGAAPSELIVLAASSLKRAFEALEDDFERQHPGVDVRFSFAGTQELRRQLEAGARADVFASADLQHMEALLQQRLVQVPIVFAENELVLVSFAGSHAPLEEFRELPRAARIVLGAPEVPIGRYSLQILERAEQEFGPRFRAQVEANIASREFNVRQVLAKVTLGEADAAIVYRSDVTPPQHGVVIVTIPESVNAVARYPIATVARAPHAPLARAWIELVRSPAGRAALQRAGFHAVDGN